VMQRIAGAETHAEPCVILARGWPEWQSAPFSD
jgi:hypothetical protein